MPQPTFAQRRPVESGAQYHVSPSARHVCRLCSHSCRNYDVMVTEQEAQRLSHSVWRQLLEDIPNDMPLVLFDTGTQQFKLNKRPDGRCVFLGSDNLCIIHKEAGMEVKPITCQFFPLHAVQAPDGVHISLNTGCRRLIEMNDNDAPLNGERAAELLAGVEAITTIGDTLPLTPDQIITYQEFGEWQDKLLNSLTRPTYHLAERDLAIFSSSPSLFAERGAGGEVPSYWPNLRDAARLLLTIPADTPAPDVTWQTIFANLQSLVRQSTLEWLPALTRPEASLTGGIALSGSAEFCAAIARQYLEGQQSALHRTARSGWVALLAAITAGLLGAQWLVEQQPDANAAHILNSVLSGALDLFFTPIGQIALTEPNQQAFLLALASIEG